MPAKLLSYRRAVLILATIITLFLLLRQTHKNPTTSNTLRTSTSTDDKPHDRNPNPARLASTGTPKFDSISRKNPSQRPLTELSHKPLRAQLSYYFPYTQTSKFPAYIWQTWRHSPASGSFPENWRPLEATWTELHPGMIHEVVTDDAALHMLRHLYSAIPNVVAAYEALPQAVLKADFFRYLILLARGGIYSDMDTAALKSAVEWVPSHVPRESYGLVIGIEADPDRDDWAEWYSRRIQFCQWTIQAKPGHPVLREIVARITEETLVRRRAGGAAAGYDQKSVVDLTGPAIWTDTVFSYFNDARYFDVENTTLPAGGSVGVGSGTAVGTDTVDGRALQSNHTVSWRNFTGITTQKLLGDVVILPITCFSPGIRTMGAGEDDHPMAFVKHLFEGSWKPEWQRHIGEEAEKKRIAEEERKKKEQEQHQQAGS